MPGATPLRLSLNEARTILRAAAADSGRIVVTRHALRQMTRRRITLTQALECLERGRITEGPALDIECGWRCWVECRVTGEDIGVVASIIRPTWW